MSVGARNDSKNRISQTLALPEMPCSAGARRARWGWWKMNIWVCANPNCGFALGHVTRNKRGTRQLQVFQRAVRISKIETVKTRVSLEGYGVVICSHCGAERTWMPGDEAIRELLKRHGDNTVKQYKRLDTVNQKNKPL